MAKGGRMAFLTQRVAERGEEIEHLLSVIQATLDTLDEGDEGSARMILRTVLRKHNRVTWHEDTDG